MGSEKFRTSREVYDRIRWDPRFDPRAYVIGYVSHGEAMKEIPFPEFEPGGEIPWHRVGYVRTQRGEVVWDRNARIDRIFGATAPGPVEAAGSACSDGHAAASRRAPPGAPKPEPKPDRMRALRPPCRRSPPGARFRPGR